MFHFLAEDVENAGPFSGIVIVALISAISAIVIAAIQKKKSTRDDDEDDEEDGDHAGVIAELRQRVSYLETDNARLREDVRREQDARETDRQDNERKLNRLMEQVNQLQLDLQNEIRRNQNEILRNRSTSN